MEARTGDFLYKDLQEFGFDTAFELINLKRRARFSITKNACMIERRRIARLHGQTVDRQLDLDVKGKSEEWGVVGMYYSRILTDRAQTCPASR
jgi:hypothetical protein